ncbi:aromatic ring-opening dioxygenase LigA [Xylanimonas allomyrinae]|uniref:aromatic ring-opening dioxygenase LigA n=1 Tax=Xylanimonas allomyrinae TaxID=2509459 RepID=UPI001B866557|nr:aromatic ring-opening dioxygenase LigA [Xylanimonas allomyrinae]
MSSTVTVRPTRTVRGIGLFAIIAGVVMILAGILVWILVATQLANEKITVSGDSTFLGGMFSGDRVAGPLTAFAQADIINDHALSSTDGQTYAQLGQDDPRREVVMTASFLRASLFTSVVSFGICLLVIALGVLFLLVGAALRRLAAGPEVSISGVGTAALASDADAYGRHASAAAAPSPSTPPAEAGPGAGGTAEAGEDGDGAGGRRA